MSMQELKIDHAREVVPDHLPQMAVSRPRVLMIGMHLTKTRGGISTLIREILASSVSDRFDITYIPSQAEDYGRSRKALLAGAAAVRVATHLALNPVDLVYIHIGSNASLYRESTYILLARSFKKKVVAHFHAGDIDEYFDLQPITGRRYIRKALNACEHFIAVSEASARKLRRYVPKASIKVIRNAIDTSLFSNSNRLPFRRAGEPVNILFVGAMGKLKGERDLLRAMAVLKSEGVAFTATFLGFGHREAEDYAGRLGVLDLIEHIGPVSTESRHTYYERADIFVLPSYAEAMPMSVIEAMAAGLPIITTPVGGTPEIITDRQNGLFIECGDVNALADRLRLLIEDRQLRKTLGAAAKHRAVNGFDVSIYAAELERYLHERHESEV
jgi:glycosyltransferase involved in cell wall biosynthesis